MALKLKKEIKKSSYYVWFLGAKESKGLRGLEYILPVINNLEEREKDIEPFKVTLQVSSKGLKIVQNIVSAQNNKKPKNETIKHFIPHNTITCVHQREDIIACILLLFNPVTKCPLHVHAYRCDSLETAAMLKSQLQMLIEKPENQKKFAEIESRLLPSVGGPDDDRRIKNGKDKKERLDSSIGSSDTGTSTKSESSEERFSSDVRVATLYDSVAAELRAKLNKNDVPILLPPRDYDTVHRQKGNLTGIELRRCLNVNIVGAPTNGKAKRMASSGGSSGIGSDHAPSPESPDVQERYHDGHSTSDEDWNADQDTGLYLIDQPTYPSPLPKYDYRAEQRNPRQFDQKVTRQHLEEHIRKKLEQRNKYHGQESFNYREETPSNGHANNHSQYRNGIERNHTRSPEYNERNSREREYKKDYNFQDYKNRERGHDREREYPERSLEREKERYEPVDDTLKRQGRQGRQEPRSRDFSDSTLKEHGRYRDMEGPERYINKYSPEKIYPEKKERSDQIQGRYKDREFEREKERERERELEKEIERERERVRIKEREKQKEREREREREKNRQRERGSDRDEREIFLDNFSVLQFSPKERFNDAKEKFLLLEKKSPPVTHQEFFPREAPISPNISKDKRNSRYYEDEDPVPQPAPRHFKSSQDLQEKRLHNREVSGPTPVDRYRSNQQKTDKYDIKRRSMFNLSTSNGDRDPKDQEPRPITRDPRDREFYYSDKHSDDRQERPQESRTLNKDYKRRSYLDQNYKSDRDHSEFEVDPRLTREKITRDIPKESGREYREWDIRDARELRDSRETRDIREVRDVRDLRDADFRDGREGVVQMREKKFPANQRYRNSYAEPSLQDGRKFANGGRTRYDILHRTNSTVSNNGRVGIASVHPY